MTRNLDGRVEVLFPINAPHLRRAIRDDMLFVHLRDTTQLRRMDEKGMYERVLPLAGEAPLDTQQRMLELAGTWNQDGL